MRPSGRMTAAVLAASLLVLTVAVTPALVALGAPGGETPAGDAIFLRYIVELVDPPLAQYEGGIGKLAPTAAYIVGDVHLDLDSPAARAYLGHLDRAQAEAKARIRMVAPGVRFDWHYRYVFNGFTARLTPAQAHLVRRLTGVRAVTVEERLEAELDASVPLVGGQAAFDAVGGIAEAGLGARFALVDSGTDSKHSMFRDDGMPAAPTGYPTATMHLRDGRVIAYPEPTLYTNNKLIGARIFVSPDVIGDTPVVSALQQITPLGQGHGMHVSGIAAGREGTYASSTSGRNVPVTLSGMAPKAYVLNYKTDFASTPEYLAMLDQMVVDEIDALNMSQGHVGWLTGLTTRHPMTRAFEGAADAGVVVVISAGNAGANGASSLSGIFKYSEKVIAVGNTTTPGSYDVKVTLSGAGRPFDTLVTVPRGVYTHTAPVAGPLFLAPDGGCSVTPDAAGKIAVIDRMGAGTCTYDQRAAFMKQSGALGAIFYYNERTTGGASATALPLPGVAVGLNGGTAFMNWLRTNPVGAQATIDNRIVRGTAEAADLLEGSSSRGPGLDWSIKPDISAPGSNILSSQVTRVGTEVVPIVAGMGGTSMSSPHVAGAATLLRSAHPRWTTAQVRSALLTTAARSIGIATGLTTSVPAAPFEAGVGRLDVGAAVDPGAFAFPSKVSFGAADLENGEFMKQWEPVDLQSASPERETWTLSVEPVTGTAPVVVPTSLTLEPGATGTFTVEMSIDAPAQADHWGDIVLARGDTGRKLRLAYYLHVDNVDTHKDVLLVNWTWGVAADDTPDHSPFYTDVLDALGLTYDVWNIDDAPASATNHRAHPTLATMKRYDLVILNANESRFALQPSVNGMPYGLFAYQNYLLGGGNMLLVGQGEMNWWRFLSKTRYGTAYQAVCAGTWPKCMIGPSQNVGCEMCLPRYFAGFTFGVTDTLAGRLLDYPEKPAKDAVEVVLPPHPSADGPFEYSLDISTGALAKDDAAGNQYTFASGDVLGDYSPGGDTYLEGRDYSYVEGVVDTLKPYAHPLWSYTGPFRNEAGEMVEATKVVGTYIAGRQEADAGIDWNAMFWGFGLEGVGQGGDDTVTRERLLGDVHNFLAHNLRADRIVPSFSPAEGLSLAFPAVADVPQLSSAEIDWGDGSEVEAFDFDMPADASIVTFPHDYAAEGMYDVKVTLYPDANFAPVYDIQGKVRGMKMGGYIYLPLTLDTAAIGATR
jgi:subtilisin family serine protease